MGITGEQKRFSTIYIRKLMGGSFYAGQTKRPDKRHEEHNRDGKEAQTVLHACPVERTDRETAQVEAALIQAMLAAGFKVRSRKVGTLAVTDPHRLDPGQFEHFIADLCRRDKCHNVQVVGGAGDLAADVLYIDPHGRRGLIQAKRYRPGNSVGNEHVQMVNGTYRDAHGCTHASIVTTSHFTPAAQQYAQRVGIAHLDDTPLNARIKGPRNAAPWN